MRSRLRAESNGSRLLAIHLEGGPSRRRGSPQRFCCAGHRMAFWSAARRWAEAAVASGLMSVDDIRNGATKACTLLLEAGSLAPIPSPQQSAAVAPGERSDEANELPKNS